MAENTKDRIMETALGLFAKEGFEAASMSDVTHIGRIVIDNVILKGTAARPDQIMIGSRVDSLSINSVSAGDVRKGELIERRGNWEVDSLTIR